ncbi:DUF6174 domain-containing protein [Streptomyces sp. HUAS TT20]|uniref:DUF6174 domain-containing protein n=1 Tax=Streptomyces sp. HUAS TT20 TaxID=3447509 RepID=UPI0021D8F8DC|nr:DUF6174 domain-containing protein [Streptomyces sp. HUAS 15-9]UXY25639.1 DUF6174 domain-containing protein [Streptomyces sp. HUAS 15-9]
MTAVRVTARSSLPRVVALIGGLLCATTACAGEGPSTRAAEHGTAWQEPAAYTYMLNSTEGERALIGTFRVTVRDGKVAKAVGLDEESRRVVRRSPGIVPTIGGLLKELEQARQDDADTAEARYAADGHPLRITLDQDENAVDDEARYVISAYEPATAS